MTFANNISRFASALAVLVLGGVASIDMGCAAPEPDASELDATPMEDESVAEAELAVGVGQLCTISPGINCDAGLTCCGGSGPFASFCRNLQYDEANCGSCGHACAAGVPCVKGVCGCTAGQTYCAASDECTTLSNDRDNCGACGNRCYTGFWCNDGDCERIPPPYEG